MTFEELVELELQDRERRAAELALPELSFDHLVEKEVEVVRFIYWREYDEVMTECLNDQGFDLEVVDNGVTYGYLPEDQQLAAQEANFLCRMKYPTDPRNAQLDPPDEQRREQYRLAVEESYPCWIEAGFEIPEPPTYETWLANSGTDEGWIPTSEAAAEARREGSLAEFYKLEPICNAVAYNFDSVMPPLPEPPD
ncbi:hypothetical protein [Nesterenkonia ebinurensis]|uniref:hypothetical protein n=1 Tax=Nesterenkonia ebinurensis TaxID=2608252 RepID=UPI00123E2E0E|nr:hypothetical protein [Nesterenkonia ebinurensis]